MNQQKDKAGLNTWRKEVCVTTRRSKCPLCWKEGPENVTFGFEIRPLFSDTEDICLKSEVTRPRPSYETYPFTQRP